MHERLLCHAWFPLCPHLADPLPSSPSTTRSLAFGEKGRAFFRNKFVRTTAFAAEQVAARRLNRGMHDRGLVAGNSGSPLNTWLLNPLDLSFASRFAWGTPNVSACFTPTFWHGECMHQFAWGSVRRPA